MDSLSVNRAILAQAGAASAPAPAVAADRTSWLGNLSGLGAKVSEAFSSNEAPTAKGSFLGGLFGNKSDSPQAVSARINSAYDGLDQRKPGQTTVQAAGMKIDEARQLRDRVCTPGGDKESCRRADHVARMVTDYRPSEDFTTAAPANKPAVSSRPGYTTSELPGCVATVRQQNPNANKEEMRQAIMDGCAH